MSSSSPSWIDAHCHLSDPRIYDALDGVLAQSRSAGVGRWVLAGYSPDDWQRQLDLKKRLGDQVVLSFGLHPWWVIEQSSENTDAGLAKLENQLPQAQLLGELGLDGYKERKATLVKQLPIFEKQLLLARQFSKPIVLHIVAAHDQALAALRAQAPWKGWVHSFSGSAEQAAVYLDLGLMISLSGSATRLPEAKLKKLLAAIPPDRLLLETDSPDQAPHLEGIEPGALNAPANLPRIAEHLGHFCGQNARVLLNRSLENIQRVL